MAILLSFITSRFERIEGSHLYIVFKYVTQKCEFMVLLNHFQLNEVYLVSLKVIIFSYHSCFPTLYTNLLKNGIDFLTSGFQDQYNRGVYRELSGRSALCGGLGSQGHLHRQHRDRHRQDGQGQNPFSQGKVGALKLIK